MNSGLGWQPQTANGAPVKDASVKPELTAEDINRPIVTVDSNGNPSGTRFRSDYEDHIKNRDFSNASQRNGVNGCHDINELNKFDITVNPVLTKDSIKILSKTPHPTVKGIYKIEYQMPALDRANQLTGAWRNKTGNQPFLKTVYDSSVISDAQMMRWGREAFGDAVNKGYTGAVRDWTGVTFNGIEIKGYIDQQGSKSVRTFFINF